MKTFSCLMFTQTHMVNAFYIKTIVFRYHLIEMLNPISLFFFVHKGTPVNDSNITVELNRNTTYDRVGSIGDSVLSRGRRARKG